MNDQIETTKVRMKCFDCWKDKTIEVPQGRHFYIAFCDTCKKETAFLIPERVG
jgi:Zn finger protein HypA/HybF involved in hydrogenase expression